MRTILAVLLCLSAVNGALGRESRNCSSYDGAFVLKDGELIRADGDTDHHWKLGKLKKKYLVKSYKSTCAAKNGSGRMTVTEHYLTLENYEFAYPDERPIDFDLLCSTFSTIDDRDVCRPGTFKGSEKYHVD